MVVQRRYQYSRNQEVVLRAMHLDRRTLQELLGDNKRIVRSAPDGGALDQILGIHPVAPVTDVMAVHAAGRGEMFLFAEQAFHLLRFGKVFDRGAADEATGGGGHVG